MKVINQVDKRIAKCSMEVGFSFDQTVFDLVQQTVNSVRVAIDSGSVSFFKPDVYQVYQTVNHVDQPLERHPQSEIEKFIAGKAHTLGFVAVDEQMSKARHGQRTLGTRNIWGVSKKELLLSIRALRANGLLEQGSGAEYVKPTDKLVAKISSEDNDAQDGFKPQQSISRLNLPNKADLLKDLGVDLERHSVLSVFVVDLDRFKSVNDTLGHLARDQCLDRVVKIIGDVIGRKGKMYRWGGDEFAVCLPDFSSDEAQATAERIRREIGASDGIDSRSSEQILEFADKAMYQSKRQGKNRVTVWNFLQKNEA